jgi:hypothetical protein
LADKVKSTIVELKEIASSTGSGGYTAAAFKADLAAGKVDSGLLAETMSFSETAKKMASKLNNDINLAKLAGSKEVSIDWAGYEEKIITPGIVAEIKAIYEEELAVSLAGAGLDALAAESKSQLKAIFSGPDGLYEMASKEEKAAEAGMLQCIADLELLEKQIEGVSTQTIAEILEQEPALRERVEEEIKNNVWAP